VNGFIKRGHRGPVASTFYRGVKRVAHNCQQPRSRAAATEFAKGPMGAQKRLLHHVFRVAFLAR